MKPLTNEELAAIAELAEVRRLRVELSARPPFVCPTCDWHFQTAALRDKHLALGSCPWITAAAELTGGWGYCWEKLG